jgi:hypothetical protein
MNWSGMARITIFWKNRREYHIQTSGIRSSNEATDESVEITTTAGYTEALRYFVEC